MKRVLKLSRIWGLLILNNVAGIKLALLYVVRLRNLAAELRLSTILRRTNLPGILLSFLIIAVANTTSYSQNGIITGKVKYGTEVLQSASVSLGNQTIYTNHKGEFSFSLKPGSYTITVTHVSYNKKEETVTVEAGSAKNIDFEMIPDEQLGEIVVVGSRSLVHRSNLNTPVPVDAFTSDQLAQTGQTNLMQMLNFTAPSLNASMQIMTEPVTLRGLDPDHTLILLNGTRYHNIAYMNPGLPRGQLGRGSVGNDLNTIPFSAIEKVEILRDGASAQYGSDAIAGVVNTRLKESTGKTSLSLHLGQHYKGDGEKFNLGIYHGINLNKKGFLSFSGDMHYRNPAFRGGEYKGTVYYPASTRDSIIALDNQKIAERGFDRKKASNAGTTKSMSFGFLMNGAYRVNSKTELYWTGTLNYQTLTFQNNHTLPRNTAAINTLLYPDGFKAITKPTIWNVSGIAGARGVVGKGIHWEYSSAYGVNSIRYNAENTNNASQQSTLGKNAPTNFYSGSVNYHQLTNTIHFTKNIIKPGDKSNIINLSWGAEMRFEDFGMKAGEDASWKNYDSTLKKMGGVTGAAHIVSGYDALNKNRNVICGYGDLEADLDDRFLVNLATRYEHYSDFGGNLAGKIALRYKIFNKLSLRGSLGNGFRAPSVQQRYYGAITNGIRVVGGVVTSTRRGIFNNEHEVTKVFGVPSLDPEKSLNMSGGLTSTISRHIYLTIDAYWIQIRNRIVLSGAFDRVTNPEVDSLLKSSSLDGYPDIQQVSFFSNAVNTRTKGIDVVINGKWKIRKAQLGGSLAANFTKTRLFGDIKTVPNLSASTANKNSLFDDEQKSDMERGQPRSKIILSLNYQREKIGFILRNTRFGENAYQFSYPRPLETFSPKILTDVSICYTPRAWLSLTAGANNVFNVYPDRIKNYVNTSEGRNIYALDVWQFGFMGGYYFVGMSFNF